METSVLGLILDTSVLVAGERRGLTVDQLLDEVRTAIGKEIEIAVSAITIAELVHSEIIGRIGAGQAAKGINVPFGDLLIGATALEQGYGVATGNLRHFDRIPNLVVKQL
jgi:predicted nucleic acid-binding protein